MHGKEALKDKQVLNLMKKERVTPKGLEANWKQVKESMTQEAKKVVEVNKRKQTKKPWITTETIILVYLLKAPLLKPSNPYEQ